MFLSAQLWFSLWFHLKVRPPPDKLASEWLPEPLADLPFVASRLFIHSLGTPSYASPGWNSTPRCGPARRGESDLNVILFLDAYYAKTLKLLNVLLVASNPTPRNTFNDIYKCSVLFVYLCVCSFVILFVYLYLFFCVFYLFLCNHLVTHLPRQKNILAILDCKPYNHAWSATFEAFGDIGLEFLKA